MSKGDRTKSSSYLYEEVLEKNFEIIENFLNKFHAVFERQDSIDENIEKIEHRILFIEQKLENEAEKIRTNAQIFDNKIKVLKDYLTFNSSQTTTTRPKSQFEIFLEDCQSQSTPEELSGTMEKFLSPFVSKIIQNSSCLEKDKKLQQLEDRHKIIESELSFLKQKYEAGQLARKKIKQLPEFLEPGQYSPQYFSKQKSQEQHRKFSEELKKQLINRMMHLKSQLIENIDNKIKSIQSMLVASLSARIGVFGKKIDEMSRKKYVEEYYEKMKGSLFQHIDHAYANKIDTKNSLMLLEKKILKLQTIEALFLEKSQPEKNSVTVSSFNFNTKQRHKMNGHRRALTPATLHTEQNIPNPKGDSIRIFKNGIQNDVITKNFGRKRIIEGNINFNFANTAY